MDQWRGPYVEVSIIRSGEYRKVVPGEMPATCRGEQNRFIQTETLALHDRYIYPLVERWCDLNGLRRIDLCGGINPTAGYESVDLHGGRIAADLNERWPFGDCEIGVFRAHDALEHLRDPIHTMKELHRCLSPQGWLLSQTPQH